MMVFLISERRTITGRFMSDLVGNPEDRFSRVEAQMKGEDCDIPVGTDSQIRAQLFKINDVVS